MECSKNWHENQPVVLNSMNQFFTFVRKEFYHIYRDRWTMIILLILPIVMLILFGFMMSTEVKDTSFAIVDPSRDVASQGIANKLSTSEYFIFSGYLDTPEQINKVFRQGEIGLVVVFSENFYQRLVHTGDAQIQLIADGSDPNRANTLTMYATSLIRSYQQERMSDQQIPYQITPEVTFLYNPTLESAFNFVPGVMGMILMLICAIMTSVSIAREKEFGNMEILLVSPMKPFQVIISKVVPYFGLSVINLATILLLSVYALGVPIRGSLSLVILISLIFIFVSLSVGILISSVVETQMVALLLSAMVMMMPVMMLSGMMFPVENMPWFFRWISELIPAKWFMVAIKKIMVQGLDISSVTKELTVLSSMAVVLISASLKSYKLRLE